jgi:hypothetical protein
MIRKILGIAMGFGLYHFLDNTEFWYKYYYGEELSFLALFIVIGLLLFRK